MGVHWKRPSLAAAVGVAAILGTVIAIVAAVLSYSQAREAEQQARDARTQNRIADVQELVSLVDDIAREPQTEAQESAAFTTDQGAKHAAETGTEMAELAEAQEAESLIAALPRDQVTPLDYYETARGLTEGGGDRQALALLGEANQADPDPRTRANILRAEAGIWYQLGNPTVAEVDDQQAQHAYDDASFAPSTAKLSNIVFTELFDATWQVGVQCSTAQQEVDSARQTISTHPSLAGISLTPLEAAIETQKDLCASKTAGHSAG